MPAAGWRATRYDMKIEEIENDFESNGWVAHAASSF